MLKFFQGENGISLIMVIILLVLVGGLTAALLTAGIFNIGFGADEVDRAQALYAADAGVEYTKNALVRLSPEQLNDLIDNQNKEKYIKFNKNNDDIYFELYNEGEEDSWINLSQNNTKFRVKLREESTDEVSFISSGRTYNELTPKTMNQRIEFSFDKSTIYDVALLLKSLDGKAWHPDREYEQGDIVLHGGSYYEATAEHDGIISGTDEDEPGVGNKWETYWNQVSSDEDKSDYLDLKGQDGDFSEDSVELVGIDSWREFLEAEETNGSYGRYVRFSGDTNAVYDYLDFNPNNDSHLAGGKITEDTFFTPQEVEFGDSIYIWASGESYEDGNIVLNEDNDKYYKATQDHDSDESNEPGFGSNWQDYWIEVDPDEIDDYQFNSVDIENSIVIIDGSLRMSGKINLVNSLLLVRNEVIFGGNTNLDKSLILTFNSNNKDNEDVATTLGNPSIDIIDLVTSNQYDNWPGIKEALDTIGDGMIESLDIVRWRQL